MPVILWMNEKSPGATQILDINKTGNDSVEEPCHTNTAIHFLFVIVGPWEKRIYIMRFTKY